MTCWRLRGFFLYVGNFGNDAIMSSSFDQRLLTVDLDFNAGPFAEQHAVADVNV
jgi:hypothetical protein